MLGDLVANYVSNTSGFTKPLVGARASFTNFVTNVKTGIAGIAGAFAPIAAIVAPIAGAFAFHKVIEDARAAAGAAKKFQAVIDATGGAAGITTKEMQEFAAQLQRTTNFEDDATVAAASMLATFTNIRGDVFKDTVKSAMDLSTIMGMELPDAVRVLGKALNDPAAGMMRLAKMGIQLSLQDKQRVKDLQNEGKLVQAQGVILAAVKGKFGGAAEAVVSPFTQVKNIVQDISENIGFALLPVLKEITTVFIDWAGPIQNATEEFKQFGEDVALTFRNFGDIFEIAGIDMELAIIGWIPEAEGLFGDLGVTLVAIWEGALAAFNVFKDHTIEGINEINHALAKGVMGAATMGLAPEASGALAEGLADAVGGKNNHGLANAFGDAFDKAAAGGFAGRGNFSDEMRKRRDELLEGIGGREEERRQRLQRKPGENQAGELPGATGKQEIKGTEASVFGSKEALSNIFAAMRSGTRSIEQKQLDAADATNDKLDELNGNLEDIAGNLAPQFQLVAGAV